MWPNTPGQPFVMSGQSSTKTPHPSWDPTSSQYGYMQPVTAPADFGKKGAPLFLTSEQPRRLDEFRRAATPLLQEQYQGGLLEALATMVTQQRTQQGQMSDQLATMGVNPAFAMGRLLPEQNQQFSEAAGRMRGEAQAGQAGAEMDLQAQIVNALGQIESYYDSLQLQNALAAKARSQARHASKAANWTTFGGAALGAGGMALGGPGGYFSS